MNVAIYLRKSRADSEAESVDETLARHKSTLLDFARGNNLTISRIYEEVISGDSLVARVKMLELLQDVEAGLYDGVLCMDIDRLGRGNMRDMGIILETLKQSGTRIITPRKIYDLSDEIDEFATEMQTFIARQELKNIVRRMKQGAHKSVSEGCHVSEPPFGYRRERVGKKSTLRVDEREAEIVSMVYDWYVNRGIGAQLISEKLNAAGVKPRKGARFSRSTVRFMLSNPVYTGKIVWNRMRVTRPKGPEDKHRARPRPEDEWIVTDGLHPAIIDDDLFNKAQDIRKSRAHPPSNTGEIKNPFAGLLYCDRCGSLMSRQALIKKYNSPRMLCLTVGCARSTRVDLIEAALMDSLKKTVAELTHGTKKSKATPTARKRESIEREITHLHSEQKTLEGQRGRLHDLLEQGVYTIDTFLERGRELSAREDIILEELEKLKRELESSGGTITAQEAVMKINYILDHYAGLPAAEKNALLKTMITKLHYWKDKTQRDDDFDLKVSYIGGI